FSSPPFDLDFFTPYGPLFGVEKKPSLDVTLPLLRFINEMEIAELPAPNAPAVVAAALTKLRETAVQTFRGSVFVKHGNDDVAIVEAGWYAKGLPYYDEQTRKVALSSLRKFFHEDVLASNRLKLQDSVKVKSSFVEELWAYAQYSDDWELIKSRWDL